MNKEVRKHFKEWCTKQYTLLEDIKFNPPESYVLLKVYRYIPPESSLIDSSKRIVTLDGKDYSKKSRERNYPLAFVLKTGTIPETQHVYKAGDLAFIPLTLCEDRMNPAWIQFNEEVKERPAPTTIKVPDMFIEGLNAWANHRSVLNPLDFESEENENLFLIPTAFLKGTWNEV